MSNAFNTTTVLSGSCTLIVHLSLAVTLAFLVVITIIYFVDCVYGKGFPLDSSQCIYLIFLFRPFSQSLISYYARLVAVGLVPERLGLMFLSLVPGG